ncbi:MAG TPA: hypothetical protein VFE24_00550 [Pirellulales bacterium]|jgi:hypothetical protein|nr:hypothetical protein [Pirellulales bacterium]
MNMIDHQSVCDALRELSSFEDQKRLWLSTGANNSEVSSFIEAQEQLYTDTGLSDALDDGSTGFSEEVNSLLLKLESMLKRVDDKHGPIHTINDPAMVVVRETACNILNLLKGKRPAGSPMD